MLLNVCIYYKTVLNVQCSNLMFQLICDKYFPIMAWQREERSGTPACRMADCSISRQFKPCVLGEADHLKSSLPLQTQQLQRLSCCTYYYLYTLLLLFNFYPQGSPFSSLLWKFGVVRFVVPSNLKYLPHFCWCKCCLQVSLAICRVVSPGN